MGQTQVFSLFYTVKSPGQSWGRRAAQKVYVPFSLASDDLQGWRRDRDLRLDMRESAHKLGTEELRMRTLSKVAVDS